jgi:ubiquinone/menaquinone biosynthesis C-methylase UbiE
MDIRIEKTIGVYDRHAQEFTDRYFSSKRSLPYFESFIKTIDGKNILDVGCGPGRYINKFFEKGFKIIGIDLSRELLEIAIEKHPKTSFAIMDMCNLAFQDQSFNGLWVCASFHHIPNDLKSLALNEFYRVLVPRGKVFISVKEGETEQFKAIDIMDGEERFFSYSTIETLSSLMKAAGFQIIEQDKNSWCSTEKWIRVIGQTL